MLKMNTRDSSSKKSIKAAVGSTLGKAFSGTKSTQSPHSSLLICPSNADSRRSTFIRLTPQPTSLYNQSRLDGSDESLYMTQTPRSSVPIPRNTHQTSRNKGWNNLYPAPTGKSPSFVPAGNSRGLQAEFLDPEERAWV